MLTKTACVTFRLRRRVRAMPEWAIFLEMMHLTRRATDDTVSPQGAVGGALTARTMPSLALEVIIADVRCKTG